MASHSHLLDSIHVIHKDNCTRRLNLSVILEGNKLFPCPPIKRPYCRDFHNSSQSQKGDLRYLSIFRSLFFGKEAIF